MSPAAIAPGTPPSRFRLLRYYLLASLGSIVGVTAVLTYVFTREIDAEIVDLAHRDAVRAIDHIRGEVESEVGSPAFAVRGTAIDGPARLAELDRVIRRASRSLGVIRIHVFDPAGTIVYSTDTEQIGNSIAGRGDAAYEAARDGSGSSILKMRDEPLDLTGRPEGEYLLETYVPIEDGPPHAVIETYQDARPVVRVIGQARRRSAWLAGGAMIALFLVLFIVVAKADRRIEQGDLALRTANARLLELTGSLEREIERRTALLVEREKLASLGTLSAGVAHEVNNPLATIAVCAEGLERRLVGEGAGSSAADPTVRRYLSLIAEETFRCKEITTRLLDFSRQDSAPRRERVDLREILESTLSLVRLQPKGARASIEWSAAGEVGPVLADPSGLRQVVFNVTDNALDATEGNGHVRWTLASEGGRAVLACRDDGKGIAAADLPRIWDPFYTTKPPGRGTGLGLSVVFGIVRRHGGEIEVESPGPGLGTTVTIRLPLEGDAA